jgi:uncharacterized membrane protein
MKKFLQKSAVLFTILMSGQAARACPFCNDEARKAIYNSSFFPNLFTMLSVFIVLAILVSILSALTGKRHRANVSKYPTRQILTPVPLTAAATVLGIGLGGFVDGIVLHQILQWHEMLSNKLPPTTLLAKTVNMFWDGVFHAFCLIVVIIGVILLWKLLWRKDIDRSGSLLGGGLLLGWGLFNIVEGTIDHHLLKLHNVREITANPDAWNFGFLALSVLMIILGSWLVRKSQHTTVSS